MTEITSQTPVGRTSWGSVFATGGGIVGTVTPFLPPPYQWMGAGLAAVFGMLATKLP
jgi:hypothetical protein